MSLGELLSDLGEFILQVLEWVFGTIGVALWWVDWLDAPVTMVIGALFIYGWLIAGIVWFCRETLTELGSFNVWVRDPAARRATLHRCRWVIRGFVLFLVAFAILILCIRLTR